MTSHSVHFYTLEGRLADFLRIYPVGRGSLWFAVEAVWERANSSYATVRNKERKGHFGLVAATLVATNPVVVPLCHGHSEMNTNQFWFHLRASGLTLEEPNRDTWFDVWHRYPVAWREFFTDELQRNLDKPAVDQNEMRDLEDVERRIRERTRSDHARAMQQYQRHPAWREHFPDCDLPGDVEPCLGGRTTP